jgi:alpha-mannosidase
LKEDAPGLYEEVKELARQGRWEVEGAMWLEPIATLQAAKVWSGK